MTIRIVVADDHPIVRAGTIMILQRDPEFEVVGEAALALCRSEHPDVALLDVRLPRVSGIAVAAALHALPGSPVVLMLSAYPDAASVWASIDAGALGYVLKSVAEADLIMAIRRVLRGEQVLLGVDGGRKEGRAVVSPQELTVLGYVARGMTSKEIVQEINSSVRTVETYLSRIYQKLGVHNRTEAVMLAQRENLLPPA